MALQRDTLPSEALFFRFNFSHYTELDLIELKMMTLNAHFPCSGGNNGKGAETRQCQEQGDEDWVLLRGVTEWRGHDRGPAGLVKCRGGGAVRVGCGRRRLEFLLLRGRAGARASRDLPMTPATVCLHGVSPAEYLEGGHPHIRTLSALRGRVSSRHCHWVNTHILG